MTEKGKWDAYSADGGLGAWSRRQPDWGLDESGVDDDDSDGEDSGTQGDLAGTYGGNEDDGSELRRPGGWNGGLSTSSVPACVPLTVCEDHKDACGQDFGG